MPGFRRSSGILLPVASLPGGGLGDAALRFVDWLADAGQSWWQILPFGPPDEFGSPYAASSAFAGTPSWLASPRAAVSAGEIEAFVASHPGWSASWAAYAGRGALADQVRFAREWTRLRAHAAARGVQILGDMAFSVAAGSADHRAHPELFRPGVVGGVPPDDWSADGQRWGTPVYDWTMIRAQGYRWWTDRFARMLELVDAVRVDHFRGFVAGWVIPARNRTARRGHWARGPGRAVFDAARAALGDFPVVAENLGLITPPVEQLRRTLGMPGTFVLQFAFADHLFHPQPEPEADDTFVYTGTHDNNTTIGWWLTASDTERARVEAAAAERGLRAAEPHWMLIRLALTSRGVVSIIPAQDVLGLGTHARTNVPGRTVGNWRWRLREGQLDASLAARLRDATAAGGRLVPA